LEKRVQEELKKREKQQQMLIQKSKLESLGKLAAGIAHELNQPLSGISMGLENIYFAHTEKRLSEEYLSNKLEIIDGYFDRIQKIIDHVRIFSREQKSVQIENIDINEVVKNALSLVETQYKNHNVRLQLKLADSLAKIQGNKYKLEQVFLNLLTNAKDAITEKEEKSEESYRKEIEIKTFENAEKVIFQIQDNGMGIPENVKENLFDPFFTTKEPAKGTGLGLSIVYGIIKEMKAEILVESVLGKGTTFIIEFEKI
jgi:C4-dicarboxylate-specific signal transduction histidine kinase